MKKVFLIIFILLSIICSFYLGHYFAIYELSKKIISANNEKKILNEQILILNDKNLKLKEMIKKNASKKKLSKNNSKEDEYKHPIDIKFETCIDSTHPYLYSNCAIENANDWDIEINKQLEQIKKVVNKADYNFINIAQIDWKKSVNSDEKVIHKFVSSHQGAINETLAFSYIANIKKQRALLLNNIYNIQVEK